MAKILIVTSGLTGIFNASSKLISVLREKGHSVTSASPNQDIITENLAFPHAYLNPLVQNSIINIPTDTNLKGIMGLIKKYISYRARRNEALLSIEPTDFLPLVESLTPDLIMIDIEMHEYIIQSYSSKIPILLLNQFFSVWSDGRLPDIQSDTIIGRGRSGTRIGIRIDFIKLLIKRNYRAFKMSLLSGGVSRKEILVKMAKKWNFPLEFIGCNLWPGPFVYEKITVLNMTSEALDFPHKKRQNLKYIGPMVNLERKDSDPITNNTYSLKEVFRKAKNSGFKIVYCSVGTMKVDDTGFLERVVAAMRELPTWILIISIGKFPEEQRFMNRTENVFTFSHVPQLEVLSRATIAIIHGGVHTINECMMLKVPMLAYSGKKSDQNGCTARLIYHGLAYAGDKDLDTSDDIRRKIIALSNDKNIKKELNKKHLLIQKQLKGNVLHELIEKAIKKER